MTGAIDLSPAHLAIVELILAEHVPECEVRAFGSRATWTARDYSDLDLAVVGDGPLHWRTLSRLREAFEESRLSMRVDVLDWHDISQSFQQVIQRDYVVLQEGQGQDKSTKWAPIVLGESCTKIGSGATPRGGKDSYLESGPYALIRSQNVYNAGFRHGGLAFIDDAQADALRNVEVASNDVLLNITGDSVARVCQVDPAVLPARVNQHVAIIRPDAARLDARFLRYYLASPEMQAMLLSWAGSGGTRNALTKKMIESIEVRAPSDVREQRAIAHVLGTLDDKIELNRRMNETLEAMARALFRSWFVDFEPVRAKMEGRWRPGQSLPGLPAHLHPLFPDRLVPSELGDIPEGWEVRPLKDFAEVVYGAPFASKRFNDSGLGLPLIRIRDLTTHSPGVFTDEQHPRGQLIKAGDIVVGMDGEFRAYIWQGSPAWLNQRVCHFKPKPGIPKVFLLESLTEPLAEFERGKVGTTVIHLGKGDIDGIELRFAGWPVMSAFEQATAGVCDRIVGNAAESRDLTSLRNTLLPRLAAGETRMGAT